MDVKFYYNASDDRAINKRLLELGNNVFVGVPRDEVSVMNPIIRFESDEILRYNYCLGYNICRRCSYVVQV